jgi:hypothetical protein
MRERDIRCNNYLPMDGLDRGEFSPEINLRSIADNCPSNVHNILGDAKSVPVHSKSSQSAPPAFPRPGRPSG